jgi:iron complex outermembrane receptor protein
MMLLAGGTAAAAEQGAPGEAAGSDDSLHVQEVVVTAQRREQNLQEVPLAVTAFTSDDVDRLQINDTVDLIYTVPNLIGNNNVGLGSSNTYYIRGVGNTESIATQDVPVGTYVDDVYISRQNANNFGLFDVERIEVLRGPQGTLFGRNTTGGAINVIMKKPSKAFGGYLEGGTGSFGAESYRGSLDLPVNDSVLTKLSFFRRKDDGYARQVSTGDELNGLDSWGVRAAVQLLPTDNLTVDLTGYLLDEDNANLLNQVDPVTGDRIVTLGIVKDRLAPLYTGDKRFNEPGNQARTGSGSATVAWDIDAITLSSISGYRRTDQRYFIDSNFAPPNPIPTGISPILNDGRHEQYSQEFRGTGKTLADRIDYVVGVYYLHEDNDTDLGTGTGTATSFTVTGDRTIQNTLSTYAAYAQADYRFADAFTATLGLRYTEEEKELSVATNPGGRGPVFSDALIAAAGIPLEQDETFVTPRAALAYQFTPDILFYVSATRGAKSGGWNGRAIANNLFLPFSPEKVWSEEIGMRSSFFDNKLRLNVTSFYAYTDDVQISAAYTNNGARIFTTTNPADLKNYGGEVEAEWLPISKLLLTASVGLQHARYTDVSDDVQAQIGACQTALAARNQTNITANCNRGFVDFAGRIATPVRAPDVSVLGSATYEIVTPLVTVRPSANFSFNDGYAIGNAGSPDSTDRAFTRRQFLYNASLLATPSALPNLSLGVGCENCSDQAYDVSFLSTTGIYLNPPRTWSARLRYAF